MAHALGLDFGTSSLRALLVDLETGQASGEVEWRYPRGTDGQISDPADPNLARQDPRDWIDGLRHAVPQVLNSSQVPPDDVIGIGTDGTGSTPLPVDSKGRALAEDPAWFDRPTALAWLWKDHTSYAEAEEITELAARQGRPYLQRCGGTYSSEWFWSKVLHCLRTDPEVFAAAASWVELCDFVPAWLTGVRDPRQMARSICAAGHKAMFADEWGGLPSAGFLAELAPELGRLRSAGLFDTASTSDRRAGILAPGPAAELGLPPGVPVAVGALDAHLGAVGAGIAVGDLVKVIGTSTCDMAVARIDGELPDVPGLCGAVRGSILPDCVGFEAGQSAVGDIFQWCARQLDGRDPSELDHEAAKIAPGASGLLALDWHNGNRSVLVDPALSGMVLGLSLHTTSAEIYRAMVEATAFGARVIAERLLSSGVAIDRVLACGGIAAKSPFVMQVYADVLDRPVSVSPSTQTCALGAAIMGAVAAGRVPSVAAAQERLCAEPSTTWSPGAAEVEVYRELFGLYRQLHDAFGLPDHRSALQPIMKQLLGIRAAARKRRN